MAPDLNVPGQASLFIERRLTYLLFIILTAWLAHAVFHQAEHEWILWSTLSLSLIAFPITFKNRLIIIAIIGAIFMLGTFLLGNALLPFWFLVSLLLVITLFAVIISGRYINFLLPSLMMNIFSIVAFLRAVFLLEGISRLMFVCIGFGIALLAQIIFWPKCFQFELKNLIRQTLKQLAVLNNNIFACYLAQEYKDNRYLFERRIHQAKNKCLILLTLLRAVTKNNKNLLANDATILQNLFDLILDQGQLRFRETDPATFNLCQTELHSISNEFDNLFHELAAGIKKKSYHLDIYGLQEKIIRLEENFQNVLQISAKDPLAFLIFIHILKKMSQAIEALYSQMLEIKFIHAQPSKTIH